MDGWIVQENKGHIQEAHRQTDERAKEGKNRRTNTQRGRDDTKLSDSTQPILEIANHLSLFSLAHRLQIRGL